MGLFNKLPKRSSSKPYTQQEAMYGILLTSVMGDRSAEEQLLVCKSGSRRKEWNTLFEVAAYMRMFGGLKKLKKTWEKTQKKLTKQYYAGGCDALIRACAASLDNDLRETAFAAACDIIFRDSAVDNEEKLLMDMLRQHLAIEPRLAKKIVRVISIRNRA